MRKSLSVSILGLGTILGAFTAFDAFAGAGCPTYLNASPLGHSTDANRIERNGGVFSVKGAVLVDLSHSGLSAPLTPPAATEIARDVSFLLNNRSDAPNRVVEIFVVDTADRANRLAEGLSGSVERRRIGDVVVDVDADHDFTRVYIPVDYLEADLRLSKRFPRFGLADAPVTVVEVPKLKRRKIGALAPGPQKKAKVHVGGLISISAEPPEAFFAAATAAELKRTGWDVSAADEADVWVYRVPDSRPDSYFEFTYASVDRPKPSAYEKKFKVATGIGPSTHPESVGGREANLLWLGDEQSGALDRYLRKVADPKLMLEDLYVERGLIQKIDSKRVVLAGTDHRYALTQKGFDQMETNPELYRRVIDEEYDAFLRTLFKDSHPDARNKSFLLATSRGCSQGCAICCSGGLSQFQYFSAERMMQELDKLAKYGEMRPGEKFNVFLVDSNFNNNPSRITRFAELYKDSPHYGRFEFFIRHNTVNGFLKAGPGGRKTPNLELIRAYRALGIKEIFMGVDSFDNASIVTLKTHKFKVAKDGADSRPIYDIEEIKALMNVLESEGLYAKGFFLTNNPWVSDVDRIDAYYNLVDIWLRNPHFSIDSARSRDVIRLKPFDGSPIGETSKLMGHSLVKDGRFVARGPLGEIDEIMNFTGLGRPLAETDAEFTLLEFWEGIQKIRGRAAHLMVTGSPVDREYAKWVLSKFKQRDQELEILLGKFADRGSAQARKMLREIAAMRSRYSGIPAFDPVVQQKMFEERIRSLEDGLQKTNPKKGGDL